MDKLVLYLGILVIGIMLQALQTDEELAMHTVFHAKHAVNRAAHAAAQQVDAGKLAEGILALDPAKAEQMAFLYLRENLRLDGELNPLPGSFLKQKVDIAVLELINSDRTFPYTYRNEEYDYEVTLYRPGVVLIVELDFPATYRLLHPIRWAVKGAAELVW